MKKLLFILILLFQTIVVCSQDLTAGLLINDLSLHPMQDIAKPAYLHTIIDPSFGTTIRRITNAGEGNVIVPMYSTIQAWNADESYMVLYNQSISKHELLNGITYEFVRILEDVTPADLEQIFWDFADPDIFYFLEKQSENFIRYSIGTQSKEILVNLRSLVDCDGGFQMGNDIQMMSWDSQVFTFRCSNDSAYAYNTFTRSLTTFSIANLSYTAPGVAPSGKRFFHQAEVYDSMGTSLTTLNISSTEHSCIGKLANGNDAYYAIAFAQGPDGNCIGDIIGHDLTTGVCFPVISQSQGYDYPQSGTHISALAHKNSEGGWIAASMMGYDKDGQSLLDQELVIAKAEDGNVIVCRIGHHRSDEDEFDYWGEPHAVISPKGTRVLFASDWSGSEDGKSVDSYVVELPAYSPTSSSVDDIFNRKQPHEIFPNPIILDGTIRFQNPKFSTVQLEIFNLKGAKVISDATDSNQFLINAKPLSSGIYFYKVSDNSNQLFAGKFVKE